jgi:hypothetical protein
MSISTVTSEALQLKLRQLLPSQQGFGTDLSASDTIIPIIDLTAAAEGSDVPEYLQTALAYGSNTSFVAAGATVTLQNTAGFYRVIGTCMNNVFNVAHLSKFEITDGVTPKIIWSFNGAAGNTDFVSESYDFTVFLNAGESLTATTTVSVFILAGSSRQVADINGTLVQPVGFTPQ